MRLVETDYNISLFNEEWILNFVDHKSLAFDTREDLEKFINGEQSAKYGYIDYHMIPTTVNYVKYYDVRPELDD